MNCSRFLSRAAVWLLTITLVGCSETKTEGVLDSHERMGRRIIDHVSEEDYPPGIFAQILGSCAGNRLYRRSDKNSRYAEVGEAVGISAVGWAHAPAMVDLDADGWLDLYATAGFMSFSPSKPDG